MCRGSYRAATGGFAQAQRFENSVMQRRADLADLFVFAGGIHAIRQENYEQIALGIDPERSAGETGVAETFRREILAGRGGLDGHVPAESAGGIADGFARGELVDGGAAQQRWWA